MENNKLLMMVLRWSELERRKETESIINNNKIKICIDVFLILYDKKDGFWKLLQ